MVESYVEFVRWLVVIVAVGFFISGLDDFFVDIYYYLYRLYRRLFIERRFPKLTEEDLRKIPEKPVAILIPAWREQAVIGRMLDHTLRSVDYRNYEIFVGTYPNDEPTMLAVAEVAELDPRIHRVVCPHPGPTNKADCLNWVLEGIRLYEKRSGRRFEILVIHDAEDIIHPLSLRLMNRLIPRIDMVQLPVVPLEVQLSHLTAGTYLDEFAEFHTKDLLVRERVAGMIPGAGVGSGFSRECIDDLAAINRNQVFNIETLTEDYDLGFRLQAIGKKAVIAQFYVERTKVVRSGWLRRREKLKRVKEIVATREFFPTTFSAATRQKSRWMLGIVFQGSQQIGWIGGFRGTYMLWRDRKALFANFVNVLGYVVLVLIWWTYFASDPDRDSAYFARVIPTHGWVWDLIVVDTLLMVHRWIQRVLGILRVANWTHILLTIPRVVWANFINFTAGVQATRQFFRTIVTGEKAAWAKTEHAFPSERHLVEFKRKLGDLLLENRLLSLSQLSHAMEVQKQTGERLGDVLTRLGYVEEERLLPVLGEQLRVEARRFDPQAVNSDLARLIPEQVAREHLMLAVGSEDGQTVVALVDPGNQPAQEWLATHLGRPYRLVLASRRNLMEGLDRAYGRPVRRRLMLGELLLQSGVITSDQLAQALEMQKRSGKRLGEILEEEGLVSRELLEAKIREQQAV